MGVYMEKLKEVEKRGVVGFTEYVRRLVVARIFSEHGWPEWLGGILLGLINILFLAIALKPFTIYSGFLNWGQHFYTLLGLDWATGKPKAIPLADRTSVGDIGLLLGAFLAAIAAAEFRLKRIPLRDYLDAVIGGVLMSTGVVLAFGCNWGGFFSALTALSGHGFAMFVGLIIGGYFGSRYVEWKSMRLFEKALEEIELSPEASEAITNQRAIPRWFKFVLAVFLITAVTAMTWASGGPHYAAMLLLGVGVGVVLQRARFCFATAFRDLFRGAEQARAIRLQTGIALGIIVGATGAAALKYMGYIDPYIYIKPVSFMNILGGVLFGFGMAIAGGCASGSLWKAAEGNTGLLAALVTAVLAYPLLRPLRDSLVQNIPYAKIFLPDALGWMGALLVIYATMFAWILLVHYIAYRNRIDPWR